MRKVNRKKEEQVVDKDYMKFIQDKHEKIN